MTNMGMRGGLMAFLSACVLTLAACGGGDSVGPTGAPGSPGAPGAPGPTGPQGPSGPAGGSVVVPSNTAPASDAAAAAWVALAPQITVTGVTIASPPVVNFRVVDAKGLPVIGLGNKSSGDGRGGTFANSVKGLPNLSFAIAKLVPGTDGAPSKWVSYIVTTVPTTSSTTSVPTRPTTDNTGTLVDHGDGSYTYTFYRDITTMKATVDAMTVTGNNNKADLGDLSYQPTLVHRLTIQLSGNAPGTGTNTPNAAEVLGYPGKPMEKPFDAIYDFIPATGAAVADSGREIVATAKCEECHRRLGGIPGDSSASSGALFHGGGRNNTKYCSVCHTEQRKYGQTEATIDANTLTFTSATNRINDIAVGNLPNHIHKTHMGEFLVKKNYNYAGLLYNEVKFPQDLRNCTKCHDGSATSTARTAQGDNWKTVPNKVACGGCHDGINFTTGVGVRLDGRTDGHEAGPQPDDSLCNTCHKAADIDVAHLPVTPPNLQSSLHVAGGNANSNSAWIASGGSVNRLPAGAIKVTYDIKSVSRNASKQPVMVFRMLQNGVRKDLNDVTTTAVDPNTGAKEIWDGYMGSPSVQFVYAVPQDGIAKPADFNGATSAYLKRLWQGTTVSGTPPGTLTGPDADGYYTATITNANIPDNATMLTGGLGYSYNVSTALPLTQTNVSGYPIAPSPLTGVANRTGGLIVIAPNSQRVANGYVGRRQIVEDARCNKCHQELGTFTEDAFHGGQRNDGTTCAWCHTPNRTSSGWSADSTYFVHAIHAGNKRARPFTWNAGSTTESFANIEYPGVLRDCETCHVPGTYDFSLGNNATGFTSTGGNPSGSSTPSTADVAANSSAGAVLNKQYRTVATGIFNGTAGTTITTYSAASGACVGAASSAQTDLGVFRLSPYIVPLTSYGLGFSFNPGTSTSNSCTPTGTLVANPAGGTLAADPATLVISPVTSVCSACHDTPQARAHMEINNGSIYQPRSTALATTETCLICHATGRIADIKVMHAK